ncbi:hypothetical protein BYT27DRAFT_7259301 [Phlegmacium glaucopus]|nr:hypothetical protein BYT27DRAFT_7259301 [Phlegmacium glaucopus]
MYIAGYRLPIDIVIAESKEESIEKESRDDANIRIYTDGSSQNGYVGAAAVMYYPRNGIISEPSRILRYRLGTDEEYSVWDVEAVGGLMALWLLRGSNRISCLPISIYSDSQAFIKSIGAQRAISGYHLVEDFTRQAESLVAHSEPTRPPEKIVLRWIAAHENVKGNERADQEAKKAAAGAATLVGHLPHSLQQPLPLSAGILKTQYMYQLKVKWKDKWNISLQKERFNNIDPAFPFNKFQKNARRPHPPPKQPDHPATNKSHPPECLSPQNR